jgi:hypothetical protein
MRYLTSAEVCRLTGVPDGTLKRMRAIGQFRPAVPSTGSRVSDLWTPMQCLSLAVGRGLRMRGIDPHEADAAAATFADMTPQHLEALFAKGRTCLCLVGNHVVAKLATRESILASDRIDRSTGATSGLLPAALDVQRVWRWLQEEVAKADRKIPREAAATGA